MFPSSHSPNSSLSNTADFIFHKTLECLSLSLLPSFYFCLSCLPQVSQNLPTFAPFRSLFMELTVHKMPEFINFFMILVDQNLPKAFMAQCGLTPSHLSYLMSTLLRVVLPPWTVNSKEGFIVSPPNAHNACHTVKINQYLSTISSVPDAIHEIFLINLHNKPIK